MVIVSVAFVGMGVMRIGNMGMGMQRGLMAVPMAVRVLQIATQITV